MKRRIFHSLLGTLVMLGLLVVAYGLDWHAMLWANPMEAPPKPAPTEIHWTKVP